MRGLRFSIFKTRHGDFSSKLIREADASLEVALRHVVGVHPENVGVVVRVLEPHDVHLAA